MPVSHFSGWLDYSKLLYNMVPCKL